MWPPLASGKSQFLVTIGLASVFWLTPVGGLTVVKLLPQELGWRIVGPSMSIAVLIAGLALVRWAGAKTPLAWFRLALITAALGNAALIAYGWLAADVRPASSWWVWLVVDGLVLLLGWRVAAPPSALLALVWAIGIGGIVQLALAGIVCPYPGTCVTNNGVIRTPLVQLVVHGYHGFNIIRQSDTYFAIQQSAGPFYYDRFLANHYQPGFAASTLEEAEVLVDRYLGRPSRPPEMHVPRLLFASPEGVTYLEYDGRFFALPPDRIPFDAESFTRGGYPTAITGDSLAEAEAAVANIQSSYLEPGEFEMREGFYPSESQDGAPFPRWAGGQAELRFLPKGVGQVLVSALVVQPQRATEAAPDLTLVLDGTPLPADRWSVTRTDPGRFVIRVRLMDVPRRSSPRQLLVLSPTFIPATRRPASDDPRELGDLRELGTLIEAISLSDGSDQLRFRDLPVHEPEPGGASHVVSSVYTWRRDTAPGGGG